MDGRGFGPDETMARNKQNVLIAESCQHLKDTSSLRPYQSYSDAAMKLLGYHILADVDQEAADVSETFNGAGHNLLMSSRHVWDEHLQRRAHACITTLASLHDNLSTRTRTSAQPRGAVTGEVAQPAADASTSGGVSARASRAYEDLKLEEWMRESRLEWETAIHEQVSNLDEEIAQVRYKRQCIEHDMAMHKETKEAKVKGLPPPAPRPYAPPPTAHQKSIMPPNPVAPPVAPQPAHPPQTAPQHLPHQPQAVLTQQRPPTHAAPRPSALRPANPTYAARSTTAQPLRPSYSAAPQQSTQPRASAGSYTHVRPQAPQHGGAASAAPAAAMNQSAAAAYASWQAAAAGLPQNGAAAGAAAAPAMAQQPGAQPQAATHNAAFANRPPPTIPSEEAQRRARMLVDVHRAQQAQTSMHAVRGLPGTRGGARKPPTPQMAPRPVMRPAGAPVAPGRAVELSQTGEPVRRGPGRPPGRGRGRGRGPGRPQRPSHTIDLI